MEFFRIIPIKTTEVSIKELLIFAKLDAMSTQLFVIGKQDKNEAEIGSLWGEFTLRRSEINGGVRFALVECPNALCWTITTGFSPNKEAIIIHLTINRKEKKQEFIDEIEDFLKDQVACLSSYFSS